MFTTASGRPSSKTNARNPHFFNLSKIKWPNERQTRLRYRHRAREAPALSQSAWKRAHPHVLRHACGFALANKGHDTRSLQAYLGHRNIQHTVRYTELSPDRIKDFWR